MCVPERLLALGLGQIRIEKSRGKEESSREKEESEGLPWGLGWTKDGRGEGIAAGERGGRMQGAINSEIALAR